MKTFKLSSLLGMIIISFAFVSCDKEPETKILDPAAPIYLNGVEMNSYTKGQELLSVKNIIKQSTHFGYYSPLGPFSICLISIDGVCERDTINNRIIVPSSFVIDQFGALYTDFLEAWGFILLNIDYDSPQINDHYPTDTLGYIPNSVMREVETKIKNAYNNSDYDSCYYFLENSFIFYPTTGELYPDIIPQGSD